MNDAMIWIGIALCLSQSAIFSGLNLAMFGISRLQLEIELKSGNRRAKKILSLREDSNYLLTTILWGNVGINVLLTLLSGSVLFGLGAFFFSTVAITFVGEIIPQAYFSRNAIKMGALLSPLLRFYQILLYPVAKPSSLILDYWLGKELTEYFKEKDIRHILEKHIEVEESDINRLEGVGALNFLSIDDLLVTEEGECIDPQSILPLPTDKGIPVFQRYDPSNKDPFMIKIYSSGKRWIIITDKKNGEPLLALDTDTFLPDVFMQDKPLDPLSYCHKPIIVRNGNTMLGNVISKLKVSPERIGDDVIDHDLILVWANEKRIITGADLLGRLLRGIVHIESHSKEDVQVVCCKEFQGVYGKGETIESALKNLSGSLYKTVKSYKDSGKYNDFIKTSNCPKLVSIREGKKETLSCPVKCPLKEEIELELT